MEQSEDSVCLNLNSGGSTYGSVNNRIATNVSAPHKKLVYCIHGKPSTGCCTVLEGEIIGGNSGEFVNTPTRENRDAADLINQHCHYQRSNEIDKKARRKLIIASILCVIFMIAEVIGGYLSNSLAIASDAAHLLTDFASFMISLFSLWMANRPSTITMNFGWYRAEVIGALTSVLLIWVVTGVLVYLGVERIRNHTFDVDAEVMLITSGLGVVVNLIMGLTLHQHGHSHGAGGGSSHSHSHSHSHTLLPNDKENINVRAAYIHVIGDFLQSFGVFLAAGVIYYNKNWAIIDPICTFLFSVLVLITTFAIMRDTLTVLMEGSPKGFDCAQVMKLLTNIDGVIRVHNLRVWALSLDKIAMSAHVAIRPGIDPQTILMVATTFIHDKYNFFETTLQIEEFQETMEDCSQCKNPV